MVCIRTYYSNRRRIKRRKKKIKREKHYQRTHTYTRASTHTNTHAHTIQCIHMCVLCIIQTVERRKSANRTMQRRQTWWANESRKNKIIIKSQTEDEKENLSPGVRHTFPCVANFHMLSNIVACALHGIDGRDSHKHTRCRGYAQRCRMGVKDGNEGKRTQHIIVVISRMRVHGEDGKPNWRQSTTQTMNGKTAEAVEHF